MYVCVCVCFCSFEYVTLTVNPSLTLLAHLSYSTVPSELENGTPSRCKAVLKAEAPGNLNPMLVDMSQFVACTCLCTFAESDTQKFKSGALGGANPNAFEQWRYCKRIGQNFIGGLSC